MKTWLMVVVALVVGLGGGFGLAIGRITLWPWDGTGIGEPEYLGVKNASPTVEGKRPRVVLKETKHDFGVMASHKKGSYKFRISNGGDAALTLSKGATSCKCTIAELDKTTLAPGESSEITLEWTGKDFSDKFQQTATINTNDPENSQLSLTVSGQIRTVFNAVPSELVFSNIAAGEPSRSTVRLYCYLYDKFNVTEAKFNDSRWLKFFEVKHRPLTAKELADNKEAKCGYQFEVTVKPGLPMGIFQQQLEVATDLPQIPPCEIAIRGSITSDISVVGPGWDEESTSLSLGTITTDQDVEKTLKLFVRGSHREKVKFKLLSKTPDLLVVEIGNPEKIGNSVTQTSVKIRIPKGSPPADHLGSEQGKLGRILLETNHPNAPQLQILVRFAIQG